MDWSVPVLAERDTQEKERSPLVSCARATRTQDGAERHGCPLAPGTLVEGI
jgi:hypothetical protein